MILFCFIVLHFLGIHYLSLKSAGLDYISEGKFCWIYGLCYLGMFSFIKVDLVCRHRKYELVKI